MIAPINNPMTLPFSDAHMLAAEYLTRAHRQLNCWVVLSVHDEVVVEPRGPQRTRAGRWRVGLPGPNGWHLRVYRTKRLAEQAQRRATAMLLTRMRDGSPQPSALRC